MIRRGSVQYQMLIVAVLPLLLLSIILGGYFIQSRLQDSDEELAKRGETIARMLAVSVEFGLLTGSISMLEGQIRGPLDEPDVADIVILDRNFYEVVRGGNSGLPVNQQQSETVFSGNYGYFLAEVRTSGIAFEDLPSEGTETDGAELLGWVAVIVSREGTRLRQQEIIVKGVTFLLIGLAFAIGFGRHFSKNMIGPLENLIAVMKSVERGEPAQRADTEAAQGELLDLTKGFNSMVHEVEDAKASLERKVDTATKALRSSMDKVESKNIALHKARERADRANLAKDEFLARMSHELRTPMTSVLGFAKLLDKTGLNTDQKEYARIINQASEMLLTIIDDILDFSKLESNAIVLEEEPFCLKTTVRNVVEMMTSVANSKRVELVMLIDPALNCDLVGDEVRIRQVLSNLMSNAVKFTDKGEVVIHVRPAGRSAGYQLVDIEVIDTGIGIPKSQVNKLFKAFSQADTSITRRYGGSGLGLAISRRLVELMGGNVSLSSQEGVGTEVKLSVPLKLAETATEVSPVLWGRVVVFDPHPLYRKSIRYQLYDVSCDVVVANTEDRLLSLLEDPAEVVIIGLAAGEELSSRNLQCLAEIRRIYDGLIVTLTSHQIELPDGLNIQQLRKPLNPSYLVELLADHGVANLPEPAMRPDFLVGKLRILVAEDNSFNQLLLRKILEGAGAEVLQVLTGDEAVICAEEFSPDLILMDVHMPEMDGIEATALIRKAGYSKPILALTANVVESEHEALLAAGVNEVMLKPIDDEKLLARIHHYEGARIEFDADGEGLEDTLERYQISKETLHAELEGQVEGLMLAFRNQDRSRIRHHTHQLIGLAGLYDMPELDVASCELNDAAKQQELQEVWEHLWRLKRLVEHQQY